MNIAYKNHEANNVMHQQIISNYSVCSYLDKRVGLNMAKQRKNLGMNRQQIAKLLNVTHQQIAKYEQGVNRVSSGKLYIISKVLCMKLDDFFI